MTRLHILAWAWIMICMPIVLALMTGMDPMGFYRDLAGMLAKAADFGVRIRG